MLSDKLSKIGICTGCVVIALVFTMVNTAIPVIQNALDAPLGSMQWMMAIFGVVNCAMLVTNGRLADMYGRKKIFLLGVASGVAAMCIGGFSSSPKQLIVSMFFAGLSNSVLLPVSQAMLIAEYPEEQKGKAIGLWAACIASAMAAGPVLGGVVSANFGWPWVFWVNIPVMIISFFFVFFFSRESKNTKDPAILDVKGMLYLATAISSFVLLSTEFRAFSSFTHSLLASSTIGASYLLWKHERAFSSPILLEELLKNRVFLAASIASGCLIFYLWSTFFLLPIYLQNIRHQSSFECGITMMGITIPVAILSPLIGKLYRPYTAWAWALFGFAFLAVSTLMQSFFISGTPLTFVLIAIFFYGIGYSFILGPTATAAVSLVTSEKAGIASGTYITIQEIGGTLGLALVISFARYFPSIQEGFQKGISALLAIVALGVVCSFLMFLQKKEFASEKN